jgi:hypothetical protein
MVSRPSAPFRRRAVVVYGTCRISALFSRESQPSGVAAGSICAEKGERRRERANKSHYKSEIISGVIIIRGNSRGKCDEKLLQIQFGILRKCNLNPQRWLEVVDVNIERRYRNVIIVAELIVAF